MATDHMNENWSTVKAQIENIWQDAEFQDSEMKKARGNLKKMVTLIHEKTGETPSEIRQKMMSII